MYIKLILAETIEADEDDVLELDYDFDDEKWNLTINGVRVRVNDPFE